MFSAAGYFARILVSAGLIENISQFPGLVNDAAGIGILIAHIALATPFFVLLFHEIYRAENIDGLARLAQTLGAAPLQVLFRVNVPILLRRSMTNIILVFIAVLGSYEIPLLLGRQAPQMISVLTLRKYEMFDISQKPEAFIAALLYTVLVLGLLVVVFLQRRGRSDAA
jgi:putative spermidine/putrescine transport system permease protein